uniref:Bromo domain-containing protein n=1 Tax=Macrostomum lignano TaxID=282301 RepID=A0A1I8FDX6_9PLAT
MQREEGTGRLLREIFVKLPPKNEYPMYYELVSDLKLMFANAKHFNEEKSQKLLKKKIKNLGPAVNASAGGPANGAGSGPGSTPQTEEKVFNQRSSAGGRQLFELAAPPSAGPVPHRQRLPLRRILSSVFARLPTRQELPQYYEFIKKPIDLTSIQSKLGSGKYTQAADMLADFELMFDNACLFNETGSQIYQDALVLLRVVMEKRRLLRLDEDPVAAEVPDVMAAVRDVMKGLLTQTMNHADEDGRLLVDSFDELYDEPAAEAIADGSSDRPVIPLEEIFHRVQSGRYRRFQRFQEDLFDAFARIRAAAPSRQSQIYKDACELQRFFVRTRDSMLCVSKYSTGSSGSLQSPASGFTCKMLEELLKSEAAKSATDSTAEAPVDTDDGFQSNTDIKEAETAARVKVLVSDFVYVRDEDQTSEPIPDPSQSGQVRIGQVVGFACETNSPTESANGEGGGGGSRLLVRVNWFLKPKQTAHSRHRKFLPNEVFKTDQRATVPANSILGKCMVMSIKDFQNFMPRGFDSKDVYACEFQYCAGQHSFFQKITRWTSPRPDGVTNDKRPSPIGLHRMAVVPYVFEAPKHEDPTATSIIESPRENYAADPNSGLWLRLGDFVYVPSVDGTGRTIV